MSYQISVRKARLYRSGASLTYYGPCVHQHAHDHDEPHISIVLSGSLKEMIPSAGIEQASAGMMRLRPRGFRHEVSFGSSGALIVTLPLHPEPDPALEQLSSWRAPMRAANFHHTLQELLVGSHEDSTMVIAELCASYLPALTRKRGQPRWLIRARDALIEEPAGISIGALAHQAGVHRVHFARVFTIHFGVPPSVFRRRAMLARALRALLFEGSSASAAALQAGFADHSHFTRTARDFIGLSPIRLRSLLG